MVLFYIIVTIERQYECQYGVVVYWLSLLHNFIRQFLDLGSKKVRILLAKCRKFAMVKISGNSAGRKKDLKPFVGQSFDKNNSSSSLSHLIKRSKDPPLLGTTYFIINGRKRKMMLTELSQTK